MEAAFSVLVGLFFAVGIYLILSKHIIRILLGIAIFGNAVNLMIFTAGRLTRAAPPVLGDGPLTVAPANPLPQALLLTAIVISFSIFAFLLVLAFRAYQSLETDSVTEMRLAEPPASRPPLGY